MQLAVKEETKTKLVFELHGENHTFCNLLKSELQSVKGVVIATYKIDHPLVGVPTLHLETSGVEPKKALKEALKEIKKKAESFKKELASL